MILRKRRKAQRIVRSGKELTVVTPLSCTSHCVAPVLDHTGTSIYLDHMVKRSEVVRIYQYEALEIHGVGLPIHRLIRSIDR